MLVSREGLNIVFGCLQILYTKERGAKEHWKNYARKDLLYDCNRPLHLIGVLNKQIKLDSMCSCIGEARNDYRALLGKSSGK